MTEKFVTAIAALVIAGSIQADDNLAGILDQLEPLLVAPEAVTTNQFEYGSSLAPDGKTFAFVRALAKFQKSTLVYSKKHPEGWSLPQLFPFTGKWHDTNPYFSKDGKYFYFATNRPTRSDTRPIPRIWRSSITEAGYTKPELVQGEVNGNHPVIYPTVHVNGDIYFCSYIQGGKGDLDLYVSRYKDGIYLKPEPLLELNTEHRDADPELTTDGKLLFFTTTRPGGLGHFDLHVSVKQSEGKWGEPIHLGAKVNSAAMDSDPILSADGNTLFFSSDKVDEILPASNMEALNARQNSINNGLMNIYSVDISALRVYLLNNSN